MIGIRRKEWGIFMQELKKARARYKAVVLLLLFSLLFAGFSADSMAAKAAKAKKETVLKTVSLKIGKKNVTQKTYTMKKGEKKVIKVSVLPKKGRRTIRFTSGNKKVVAVDQKGRVTAKKTGSAKIKVTVKAGKKGGKISAKKATWVKIKVIKADTSNQKEESNPPSEQPTNPAPDSPTPSTEPEKPSVPPTEIPTQTPTETPTEPPSPTPGTSEPVNSSKSLVAYFSCTDTTKKIAEYIQESIGADLYRIEAEVPYTAEDLNYGDSSTRATKEQNDSSARPAISGKVENMAQYQNVVIAYPIWLAYHNLIQCTQA